MRRLWDLYSRYEAVILGVVGLVGAVALWEWGGRRMADPNFISRPTLVWESAKAQWASGQLLRDTVITLQELAIGFGIAAAFGIVVGLLMGWYRLVEFSLHPYLWFFYSAPTVAFYPLLIFWLGLGQPTIIALTFLLGVFPIIANTITAVQTVDPVLIRAARSFCATPVQIFTRVVLPASLPMVVAGLRLGLGRALIGAVVGEFFGANAGLGYRISFYGAKVRTADLLVPLVVVMLLGTALTQLLSWCENRISTWRTT